MLKPILTLVLALTLSSVAVAATIEITVLKATKKVGGTEVELEIKIQGAPNTKYQFRVQRQEPGDIFRNYEGPYMPTTDGKGVFIDKYTQFPSTLKSGVTYTFKAELWGEKDKIGVNPPMDTKMKDLFVP